MLYGMRSVKHFLNCIDTIFFFALHDVLLGEHQVIDDCIGLGPLPKQVVALEKGIVSVTGVSDHQRLHGHGVLFHEVRNAGVGIDHHLVGKVLLPGFVQMLVNRKGFAVTPVWIHHGHGTAGIRIQHLLGTDHFNLIGEGVEFVFVGCNVVKLRVNVTQQIKCPLIAGQVKLLGHCCYS